MCWVSAPAVLVQGAILGLAQSKCIDFSHSGWSKSTRAKHTDAAGRILKQKDRCVFLQKGSMIKARRQVSFNLKTLLYTSRNISVHTCMRVCESVHNWDLELPRERLSCRPLTLDAFFFTIYFFIFLNLFLAALGLRCCTRAFSSCGEWGLLFVAVRGLLIAVASLVVEHGL